MLLSCVSSLHVVILLHAVIEMHSRLNLYIYYSALNDDFTRSPKFAWNGDIK